MNNLQSTLLIPYDASGDLESTKESIKKGVLKTWEMFESLHPDIESGRLSDLFQDIIYTNWAITAITANSQK